MDIGGFSNKGDRRAEVEGCSGITVVSDVSLSRTQRVGNGDGRDKSIGESAVFNGVFATFTFPVGTDFACEVGFGLRVRICELSRLSG